MDNHIHPTVRATIIAESLTDTAQFHLNKLFHTVNAMVPAARMTKSNDALVVPNHNNTRQLIVTIPTTGDNAITLCAPLTDEFLNLKMSWMVFTTSTQDDVIVGAVKPEYYLVSTDKIVEWVTRI